MALLFLFAAAFLLFFPSNDSHGPESLKRLGDAFHLPLFAIILWSVAQLLAAQYSRLKNAIVAVSLAAAVELLQPIVGRECSWIDLRNGILGVLIAASFPVPFETRARAILFAVVALGSSIFVSLPAWRALRGEVWQDNHFPILADFEDPLELGAWRSASAADEEAAHFVRSNEFASEGAFSLQMVFPENSWSAVCFLASDRDWSAFRTLTFDIRAPVHPFALHLRIDDNGDVERFDSRFNAALPVPQGWTKQEISIEQIAQGSGGRGLNLHAIRRLCFFAADEKIAQQAYLDNLRLVR